MEIMKLNENSDHNATNPFIDGVMGVGLLGYQDFRYIPQTIGSTYICFVYTIQKDISQDKIKHEDIRELPKTFTQSLVENSV